MTNYKKGKTNKEMMKKTITKGEIVKRKEEKNISEKFRFKVRVTQILAKEKKNVNTEEN